MIHLPTTLAFHGYAHEWHWRPEAWASMVDVLCRESTANFFMTEMTGSPRSLCLRPEHEMHLKDMVTLDLGYGTRDGEDFSVAATKANSQLVVLA
jgi:hypothetical protein